MPSRTQMNPQDMAAFESDSKLGFLATITPEGLPHLSFITSLQGKDASTLMWGQFCEGISKQNVKQRPETGFLVMNLQKQMWNGKAHYTNAQKEGDDYIMYNNKPLFRYNSYFGIHTVHYMKVKEINGPQKLPMSRIVAASIKTSLTKGAVKDESQNPILTPFSVSLFNAMGNLSFAAAIDGDGYPFVVPLIEAQAADPNRIAFAHGPYAAPLDRLEPGTPIVVFALSLKMENVLVRGNFSGFTRKRGLKTGVVDIDYVYNSMPPNHRQIYPETPLTAVREF